MKKVKTGGYIEMNGMVNTIRSLYENVFSSAKNHFVILILFAGVLFTAILAFPQTSYANTLTVSGLVANNTTQTVTARNTQLIQEAMETVSAQGGGKVVIPAGTYYLDRLNDTGYNKAYYCLIPQDNVLLTGSTSRASDTVLKPINYNRTEERKWGVDCFFFQNNFSSTKYATGRMGESRSWLDNADFANFTVNSENVGITNGADYNCSGKGFYFMQFKNCDWDNVAVYNTDGTGFGVDFPINCTMKNCYASGNGKAALLSGAGFAGASGFGIGIGKVSNETMIIENCTSEGNANFGFFFEHQRRFGTDNPALTSNKFYIKNCTASGNYHNFGGTRTHDTYYYNCKSVKNSSSTQEKYTKDAFVFENYSVRSNFVNCSVTQTYTDISSITSAQKNAINWGLKEGIITVGGTGSTSTTFNPNKEIAPCDYLLMLYRVCDHSKDNIPMAYDGDDLINAVKSEIGSVPADIELDSYWGQAYRWAKKIGLDLSTFEKWTDWNGNGKLIASWLTTLSKNTQYKSYFNSKTQTAITKYQSNSLATTRIALLEQLYGIVNNTTITPPTLVTTPVPNSEDGGYITVSSSFANSVLGAPSSFGAFTLGFYLNGATLKYQISYTPGTVVSTPLLPLGTYTVRPVNTPSGYTITTGSATIFTDGGYTPCSLSATVNSGTANFNATCNGIGVAAGTYSVQRQSTGESITTVNFPPNGIASLQLYPDSYVLRPISVTSPYVDTNTYNFTVPNGGYQTVNVVVTTPLDMTSLSTAMNQAQQLLNDTPVSTNGRDLTQGQQYVTSNVAQDLQDALNRAQQISSLASSQTELDSAASTLNSAIQTFRSNILIAPGPLDLDQLNASLQEANGLLSTTVSENGLDLQPGQQYATQAMIDELNAAIVSARSAMTSFTDQESVDSVAATLAAAVTKFKSEIRTSSGPIITSSLTDAMSQAQDLISGTLVSTDGRDLVQGQKYATQAMIDELQGVLDTVNARYPSLESQDEADSLKTMLESAMQKFKSALKTAPGPVDISLLQSSISEANSLLSTTAVSVDGTDLSRGAKYVTSSIARALQLAVDTASAQLGNITSQADANTVNKTLRTEIQKFKNSIKLAPGPISTAALKSSMSKANKLLNSTQVSDSGRSLKKGVKFVLPTIATSLRNAINKAQTVCSTPKSQSNVDQTNNNLLKAISSFNISIQTAEGPFVDVKENAWYEDAIEWANENDLLTGYKGTDLFGPNDRLTRGQAAVIIWRYYEPAKAEKYVESKGKNTTPFTDNLNGKYYTEAINWAYKNKIFTGYAGTNTVGVYDSLTREQLCTMLYRCATQISKASKSYSMSKFNTFPDKSEVSSYAITQVAWSLDKGVINGWDGKLIAPTMVVDRAQMSQVMMNITDKGIMKMSK